MLKKLRAYRLKKRARKLTTARTKGWSWAVSAFYRDGKCLAEIESYIFLPYSSAYNLLFPSQPSEFERAFDLGASAGVSFIEEHEAKINPPS